MSAERALRPAPPPVLELPIRIVLRDLLEAQPALQRLAAEKLPVKLAYNVARMIKAIQPDYDEFVKQRNDLVKKYGATRQAATDAERAMHGPEVTEVTAANVIAFRRELDELTSIDVVIDRAPLVLSVDKISAADLIALGPLVSEPE